MEGTYVLAADAAGVLLAEAALLVGDEAGVAFVQPLEVSLRQARPSTAP